MRYFCFELTIKTILIMATSFLTNLNEEEFKAFLKQAFNEIMGDKISKERSALPEILDIKQAAEFLKLKVSTVYEKTSQKTIPHFKKGNKLYFNQNELQSWLMEGKVKTNNEIEGDASTFLMTKKRKSKF
jgi:excisionase family DNA binding protein